LAALCLWSIGDWSEGGGPLLVASKIIWGTWWVLAIATVLVRIAIFAANRRQALPPRDDKGPPAPIDGQGPSGTAPSGNGEDGAKLPAQPTTQDETPSAASKGH